VEAAGAKGAAVSLRSGAREKRIHALLEETAKEVRLVEPRRWRLMLATNGKSRTGEARLVDDWLLLDAPLKRNGRINKWNLLERNGSLAGLGKFGLLAGEKRPRLLAEIPVDAAGDLAAVLRPTLRGLAEGVGGGKGSMTAEELAGLCSEAGWPTDEKRDGRLVAQLPVAAGIFRAELATGEGGEARARAPLGECASPSPLYRHALARFLLEACGAVRHARAAIDDEGGKYSIFFEVRLFGDPDAGRLHHALSSLTVACDLCGREAGLLQDRAVAQRYLESR
jgi:hypothetical protein